MRDRLKYVNYAIISFVLYLLVISFDLGFFWTCGIMIAANMAIIALVDAIDSQDNLYLLSLMISLPFVLYWTEEGGEMASQNIFMLLGTVALCVLLPFVFILLFDLWELAGEQ